jgi:hypothetical protein
LLFDREHAAILPNGFVEWPFLHFLSLDKILDSIKIKTNVRSFMNRK